MIEMPEKMTKDERIVSLAIDAVRKAKQMLQEGSNERVPLEDESEHVKVTKPKNLRADKILNQTQKVEGYGLAGEMTDNS